MSKGRQNLAASSNGMPKTARDATRCSEVAGRGLTPRCPLGELWLDGSSFREIKPNILRFLASFSFRDGEVDLLPQAAES